MTLRRELLVSFGVQGLGAASVLLATLLLGARLGPEVQGGFSHTKAELEFVAAFAMFGLPQALFFYVKSQRMAGKAALRWALAVSLLAAPLGALYAAWRGLPAAGMAALAVAALAMVAHGVLRALLLVRERSAWFNLLTALPQVLMLALVGLAIALGAARGGAAGGATWCGLFALAYALAAAVAWRRLGSAWRGEDAPAAGLGWPVLLRFGLATWLTAAAVTAATLLVQRWVEAGQGAAALGQFTLAMTLVQVPLTPISYAAPLLLRRWMERPGGAAARRVAALVFAALCLCALAAWALGAVWPDLGLGRGYGGATQALALLLAGGAAEAASRVLTVHAHASGTPWVAVRAESARCAVLLLGWLAVRQPTLLQVCLLWALGAWAAAAVFAWRARRAVREEAEPCA